MRAAALAAIYLLDNISLVPNQARLQLNTIIHGTYWKGHAQGKKCFCHHLMRDDLPSAVRVPTAAHVVDTVHTMKVQYLPDSEIGL